VKASRIPDEETLHKAMDAAPTAESRVPVTRTAFDHVNPDKMPPPLVLDARPKPRQYAYQRIAAEKANK